MSFSRARRPELEAAVEDARTRFLARGRADGKDAELDGGPGSGNWGHRGVPGKHGGSAPGGGLHNRREAPGTTGKYTSFSKQRAIAAKMHDISWSESKRYPDGAVLITEKGRRYVKKYGSFYDGLVSLPPGGARGRVVIPEKNNPNLQKGVDNVDFGGYRERMEKAPRYESKKDVDARLRGPSGELWKSLSKDEKKALNEYTGVGYKKMNRFLRAGEETPGTEKSCALIKKALDGTATREDMWVQRGTDAEAVRGLFGITERDLEDIVSGNVPASSIVGLSGRDKGFLSTGSTTGAGFPGEIAMHIFVPKGTKGVYAEPFSRHGGGDGLDWDGERGQDRFGGEFETILQCGTGLQIARAWVEGDTLHVESFVTGQE